MILITMIIGPRGRLRAPRRSSAVITASNASENQTRKVSIAMGATVAAKSRTAMMRNHWVGNVARRKVMAGMCADSRFGKMILFKGLDSQTKSLIQLLLSSLAIVGPIRTAASSSTPTAWRVMTHSSLRQRNRRSYAVDTLFFLSTG